LFRAPSRARSIATVIATRTRVRRRLANALTRLGVKPGSAWRTLAWNGYRHFELYYAISGIGGVIHTINPRLHPDQVAWIANDADDQYLFFDATFAPIVDAVAAKVPDGEKAGSR